MPSSKDDVLARCGQDFMSDHDFRVRAKRYRYLPSRLTFFLIRTDLIPWLVSKLRPYVGRGNGRSSSSSDSCSTHSYRFASTRRMRAIRNAHGLGVWTYWVKTFPSTLCGKLIQWARETIKKNMRSTSIEHSCLEGQVLPKSKGLIGPVLSNHRVILAHPPKQ